MNKEEIIKLAREAGLDPDLWNYTDAFERFAALVAAHEREACARLLLNVSLDSMDSDHRLQSWTATV